MEVELIDYPMAQNGIGAYLESGEDGFGARVGQLITGQLAEQVSHLSKC